MRPLDEYRNGDVGCSSGGSGSGSDSEAECGNEAEQCELEEAGAPARALLALNALRKSRQHYDVVLLAAGAEVPAHRALLAAHSAYLLHELAQPACPPTPAPAPTPPAQTPPPAAPALSPAGGGGGVVAPDSPPAVDAYRVEGVEAESLRALVEYAYTGRLRWRGAAGARALYLAAWRLRVESARAALAAHLTRRLRAHHCLPLRALPDLPQQHLHHLDSYIAHNFDEVCGGGALAALPLIRIELLRATSTVGGSEAPLAVADAALAWLRDTQHHATLESLCARTHLLYVDGSGALRDCGELPASRGDAPELAEYRREAREEARRPHPAPGGGGGGALVLPGRPLGARAAPAECRVLGARGAEHGGARVTRALVVLRGRLAAARVSWRECAVGAEVGASAVGGPLGGLAARHEPAGGERRASLCGGARCAVGLGALGGRLVVCGGYDRARVLRAAAAYCARGNAWRALPDMRSARARFPAARLGRALYALGGSDGHAELDSVDVYEEPADGAGAGVEGEGRWRGAARLPLAVSHAGAAADEAAGRLYVLGGAAGGRPLRQVHRYEPATDTWHEAPPLKQARSQCAGACWGGSVWALGGCDAWHCLASTERLAAGGLGAGEWAPGPALPTARRSVGGAVWRGRLAAAGGSDGAASLRRVDWLLGPHEAAWRAGPHMRRARAALGLAVMDDVLYAVAGFDGKEFLSCVECLYAPDGEWTALCAPPVTQTLPTPASTTVPPPPPPPADIQQQHDEEQTERAREHEPPAPDH